MARGARSKSSNARQPRTAAPGKRGMAKTSTSGGATPAIAGGRKRVPVTPVRDVGRRAGKITENQDRRFDE